MACWWLCSCLAGNVLLNMQVYEEVDTVINLHPPVQFKNPEVSDEYE